jgi:6-phosphofructo-2-kinase
MQSYYQWKVAIPHTAVPAHTRCHTTANQIPWAANHPMKRTISDVTDVSPRMNPSEGQSSPRSGLWGGHDRPALPLPSAGSDASRQYIPSQFAVNPTRVIQDRVVVAMVGLPARGKSYISKAVVRYLKFLGCPTRLFNAGNKRRAKGLAGADASFFDASNSDAKQQREQMAMETLDDLLCWLNSAPPGCACGIFDATNTTIARRKAVIQRCAAAESASGKPIRLLFLECVCNDKAILKQSYRMKLINADYEGSDPDRGLADFISRVAEYEKVYETITDEEAAGFEAEFATNGGRLRYVQTVDAGRKLVASGCNSYLMGHMVSLLHTTHLFPRKIWILLAGESENDCRGIRGGDSELSEAGKVYSAALCALVRSRERLGVGAPQILTGTLRRYEQTVELLCGGAGDGGSGGGGGSGDGASGGTSGDGPSGAGTSCANASLDGTDWAQGTRLKLKALNELCFGSLEGLPGGRLRQSFPQEYGRRLYDPLHYRYPGVGGDSYSDIVSNCREVVLTLEQTVSDVAVVCDLAVARVLYGYFDGTDVEQIPNIELEAGLIELERSHSGFSRTHLRVEEGKPSLLLR